MAVETSAHKVDTNLLHALDEFRIDADVLHTVPELVLARKSVSGCTSPSS